MAITTLYVHVDEIISLKLEKDVNATFLPDKRGTWKIANLFTDRLESVKEYRIRVRNRRQVNMGVIYETTRVHAREPGSRWMHHAEMDRAPLWQPETTGCTILHQRSLDSDDTAICEPRRFSLPDVLSRSFHNRCFHAIDTKPRDYDPPVWITLVHAILSIKLSRTSTLFSFSFFFRFSIVGSVLIVEYLFLFSFDEQRINKELSK